MTRERARLVAVCPVERLIADRGVAALVDGVAVAVFLLADGELHTIDNVDPFSGASVLSRGIVGDADGVADRAVAACTSSASTCAPGAASTTRRRASAVHDVAGVVDGVVRGRG